MKKYFKYLLAFLISAFFILGAFKMPTKAGSPEEKDILQTLPTCYQQGDSRWNYHEIGGQTIGASACGLFSLINSVNFLTGNWIDPLELATYAHDIKAFNIPEGGGTWREILYRQVDKYEQKYGFIMKAPSLSGGADSTVLKGHLRDGGAAIAHVKGHFIALCGYDEETNMFLVYDSAANVSRRCDYNCATWMSEHELKTLEYMTFQWYCLLLNNTKRKTQLDGWQNRTNGKAEATYYINGNTLDASPYISGYALDSREVVKYYYVMDYDEAHPVLLEPTTRTDVDTEDFPYNPNLLGFRGKIDCTGLSLGSHTANVCAQTKDGGVLTIAEVEVKIGNTNPYDDLNNTFTLDMSFFADDSDVINGWPDAGISGYLFRANYDHYLNLGNINLNDYWLCKIYYNVPGNFDSDRDGKQSVIGLKYVSASFGYHGIEQNFIGDLGHYNMLNGDGSWSNQKTMEIGLSNKYNGRIYLSGYHQESEHYAVTKIVFYKNTSATPDTTMKEIKVDGNPDYVSLAFDKVPTSKLVLKNQFGAIFDTVIPEPNNNIYVFKINKSSIDKLYLYSTYSGNIYISTPSVPYYGRHDSSGHEVLYSFDNTVGTPKYKKVSHAEYYDLVEPTCEEKGYKKGYCFYCNEETSNVTYDAKGHVNEPVTIDEHTHTDVCGVCGKILGTSDHSFKYEYDFTTHYGLCDCGYTSNQEKHNFDENHVCTSCKYECTHTKTKTIIGKPASCTEEGLTDEVVCKFCGKIIEEQVTINKLEHEYENGTCIHCGKVEEKSNEPTEKSGCNNSSLILYSLICSLSTALYLIRKKQ